MAQCVLGAAQAGSVLLAAGVIAPSCQPPLVAELALASRRQGRDRVRDLDPGGIKSCASPGFRHVHALDDQAYKLSSLAEVGAGPQPPGVGLQDDALPASSVDQRVESLNLALQPRPDGAVAAQR